MKHNKKPETATTREMFYSTEMKLEEYFRKFSAKNVFFEKSLTRTQRTRRMWQIIAIALLLLAGFYMLFMNDIAYKALGIVLLIAVIFLFKDLTDKSFNSYVGEFHGFKLKQYYEVDHFCRKALRLTLDEYAVLAERCRQRSGELRFNPVKLMTLIGLFLSILGLVTSTQSINPELSKTIWVITISGLGALVAFSALARIPIDVILNGRSNRLKKLSNILADIPLNKEYQRFKAQKDNEL